MIWISEIGVKINLKIEARAIGLDEQICMPQKTNHWGKYFPLFISYLVKLVDSRGEKYRNLIYFEKKYIVPGHRNSCIYFQVGSLLPNLTDNTKPYVSLKQNTDKERRTRQMLLMSGPRCFIHNYVFGGVAWQAIYCLPEANIRILFHGHLFTGVLDIL